MIAQNLDYKTDSKSDSKSNKAELLRKIKIKKDQLKIAHEGNMPYVAEALQTQLEELMTKVDSQPDSEFQALMNLVEE